MHVVISASSIAVPTLLFGAFDRHNFGDLLFPHIVAALLGDKNFVFAGLAERDLRRFGGHRVASLSNLAQQWREHPVHVIHAGGELLTCDAWQAAVMLLPPRQAHAAIARFDARPSEGMAWAHRELGISSLAPYSVQRNLFPHAKSVMYNAVGGVELGSSDPALRHEVINNLKAADAVGVRDTLTQNQLRVAGVQTHLLPDPAVMVAELFGDRILDSSKRGEVAEIMKAFPQGYVAVQFSADFGDDATLQEIASQLDQVALSARCGIVFFRAGAAPWHDDLSCYSRVASRMRSARAMLMSLNLWDICALIARSRGYLGSSLHGRIVAMAFALPRLNMIHPWQTARRTKQGAFAATWEDAAFPYAVAPSGIAQGMQQALSMDRSMLAHKASELAGIYRREFAAICRCMD